MAQYIPKDALVAEIEKKKIPFKKDIEDGVYPTYLCALMDFEDFINTLEVKEVDLEKKAENFVKTGEFVKNESPVLTIAKHFFELGMQISNKARKRE